MVSFPCTLSVTNEAEGPTELTCLVSVVVAIDRVGRVPEWGIPKG